MFSKYYFIAISFQTLFEISAQISSRAAVDCEWDDWRIGECSKTCGGGERTNIRNKITEATDGGEECSGTSTSTESCNTQECPGECYILLKYA